jgi:hypothetical protein
MRHTPGEIGTGAIATNLWSDDGIHKIASCSENELPSGVQIANTERLALCWNCHDELVAALKMLSDCCVSPAIDAPGINGETFAEARELTQAVFKKIRAIKRAQFRPAS